MVRTLRGHLAPALAACVFALPLVYLLLGSLRGRGLPPPSGLELVPAEASLAAYGEVLELLPVATYVRNSLVVVGFAVPLTVLVASLAGYGIRLLPARARRRAVVAVIGLLLVPATAVWATRFEVVRLLGIGDTLLPVGMTALFGTSPFYVLVYAWVFHRVDDETLEAARLDGAGPLTSWWSVALPQAAPATMAVAVLAFAHHWGSFIDPLLYLRSASSFTSTQGLRLLQQLSPTDWPLLMAGGVLLTLPPILVFLWGQRVFLGDEALAGPGADP